MNLTLYPFDLPEVAERTAYITMWNDSLKPSLRLSDEGLAKISEMTGASPLAGQPDPTACRRIGLLYA
jgi:hypothetical protein